MYYLEDLSDGLELRLGSISLTKQEMIAFAEKFDPQAFHLDEDVANEMFGGLIASGWHTASLCHRLVVDGFLASAACMASPGIDELRFLKPVFAGDILSASLTVVDTRHSEKKPDRGLATLRVELANARGELVLSLLGKVIIGCRP